jgi:hypothetical protein
MPEAATNAILRRRRIGGTELSRCMNGSPTNDPTETNHRWVRRAGSRLRRGDPLHRRSDAGSVATPLVDAVSGVPAVSNIMDLSDVDGALVCVPVEHVQETARDLLQHKVPMVECAKLHRGAFVRHKAAIDKMADRYRTAAVVGAGWDPGMLSLFRGLLGRRGCQRCALHRTPSRRRYDAALRLCRARG